MKLIVVIPAYNEEKTIVKVIKKIPRSIEGIKSINVLVIDDGSSDNTCHLAKEAGAEVISHERNLGLGVAFSFGAKEALSKKADILVTLDADDQFDPKDIPKLIKPILMGRADFVTGSRFDQEFSQPNRQKIKLIGNIFMSKFISLVCGRKFSDVSCGFRAYSKEALFNLNLFGRFTYTQEVILSLSFKDLRMEEIPIGVTYFPDRISHITGNLGKYVFNSSKIIFRTIIDYMPLRIFGGLGATLFIIGSILDILMLKIFLKTGQFTPFKFIGITGLILNFMGLSLFIVGLIADILNRIRQNQERILYHQKKESFNQ